MEWPLWITLPALGGFVRNFIVRRGAELLTDGESKSGKQNGRGRRRSAATLPFTLPFRAYQ